MNTQHTPGPWKLEIWHDKNARIWDATGQQMLCKVSHYGPDDSKVLTSEELANACLIAAAPELLAALSALVNGEITLSNKSSALYSRGDFKGYLSEHCPKVIAARAAIAQAAGKSIDTGPRV